MIRDFSPNTCGHSATNKCQDSHFLYFWNPHVCLIIIYWKNWFKMKVFLKMLLGKYHTRIIIFCLWIFPSPVDILLYQGFFFFYNVKQKLDGEKEFKQETTIFSFEMINLAEPLRTPLLGSGKQKLIQEDR